MAYKADSLYVESWTVGEDVGVGKYAATTIAGASGNFIVRGRDTVDEILGVMGGQGVPSVTVNLTNRDIITIFNINQVNFVPTNQIFET